jgi:hypothetical protein
MSCHAVLRADALLLLLLLLMPYCWYVVCTGHAGRDCHVPRSGYG